MLSPEVCQWLAYWSALASEDGPPDRSLLDLRKLTGLLSWMFILEMGDDGGLRYRLAGSSLEEAIGSGMSGRTYADIFADKEQADVMEELYATALVQSSGLLRTGAFSFEKKRALEMEVLALPFADSRAMGGTVLVGIVAPFDSLNQGFLDHWGQFDHDMNQLMVVPAPRILTQSHLSDRVNALLKDIDIAIRALDTRRVLEMYGKGWDSSIEPGLPSFSVDAFDLTQGRGLN